MTNFSKHQSMEELGVDFQQLIHRAKELLPSAYAPYSNFLVASALLLENGEVITGTNQENAAYPSGLCAERLAIFSANAQFPNTKIKKIAIIAQRVGETTLTPVTSCGACRQVMLESENRQETPFEIVMQSEKGTWLVVSSAAALLPFAFTKSSL